MVLSRRKRRGINIDRGIFTKVCKKLQDTGNLDFVLCNNDNVSVATAVFSNANNKQYILNVCLMDGEGVSAILIDTSILQLRYTVELQTQKLNADGEFEKCDESDVNTFIDNFVNEVVAICK